MNFKNKRPRTGRAGCGLCKPQKKGWVSSTTLGHRGYGKLRKEKIASASLKEWRDHMMLDT